MKKRIIYLITLSLMIVTFNSCEDQLDQFPSGEIVEQDVFVKLSDAEKVLLGAYAAIGSNDVSWNSIASDNLSFSPTNNGGTTAVHNWSYDPSTGNVSGIWSNNYAIINRANRFLIGVESTEVTSEEVDTKNQYVAEALALRAYGHLNLLRYFSNLKDASSLGVPYVTSVDIFLSPSRDTVGDCVQLIKDDLTQALALMPDSQQNPTRITKSAIYAILAQLNLEIEDYQGVIDNTTSLISSFPLASSSDFSNIWIDTSNTEIIFKKAISPTEGTTIGSIFASTGANSNVAYYAASELYNLYVQNDVRKTSYFQSSADGILVNKYPGSRGVEKMSDYKLYRVSEMILIRAEAYANLGNISLAQDDYNYLRNARISNYIAENFDTQEEVLSAIINEKRLELAFEGERWFDLKRYNSDILRSSSDCDSNRFQCTFGDDLKFMYQLPIPTSEMFANENMVQNANY